MVAERSLGLGRVGWSCGPGPARFSKRSKHRIPVVCRAGDLIGAAGSFRHFQGHDVALWTAAPWTSLFQLQLSHPRSLLVGLARPPPAPFLAATIICEHILCRKYLSLLRVGSSLDCWPLLFSRGVNNNSLPCDTVTHNHVQVHQGLLRRGRRRQ